ncbi:tRNA guanosine(34) transglycosylase Tgt [Silvanigrella aquatica]|uniref:Queuine tRNA-ribosyltransferase n=1 Tax=Silvanigrella aquatica TaxID=1915309 RepID=A0A1L4D439_9BACT|nr:tRNA guanosine(34) transglycosylase Tgt [Silvanigrella aquatica]APJ04971.1 tRNA guanosine(34) transglycosylase Tgt [Silvanigrella aquatica]
MALKFDYLAKDPHSEARRGRIHTAHGIIETPVFMPVGTFGSVRTLDHTELEDIGVQIILGNTYHLYLRPGPEILKDLGGYHKLISWNKPILTDSGGFQIFSLPHQRVISEKGVTFKSYIDQSYKRLTPESDIAFQEVIGSDIMMVLDVCVPSTSSYDVCVEAMNRTHRWAKRCKQAKTREENSLFGIVQGAIFENLRTESAEALTSLNFDGYAIGGLAVGESDEERDHFTRFSAKLLPENKPRYLMGVGTPHDLVRSVLAGVDMFDCIIPTNHARQGVAYTFAGKVKLRRVFHAREDKPIDESCACYVCKRFSRAYLHQLTKCEEPTGWKLISYHNTWFYERLMEKVRETIVDGTFSTFAKNFLENAEE